MSSSKDAFEFPPAEALETLRYLIFDHNDEQPVLTRGSSNERLDLDVLRWKNLFLLISSLNISEDDFSHLKPVYEGVVKDGKYQIVWIPVVHKWGAEEERTYDELRGTMPWYTVRFSSPAGIRYIKEEWNFRGSPIVVVMNSIGQVKNTNALPLIRTDATAAFPFHVGKQKA